MALTAEQKKLLYWQIATEGMDVFEIPENAYTAKAKQDKSKRFTTFVKEFIGKVLNGERTDVRFFETVDGLPDVYKGAVDGDWWKQAKMLGEGKRPENSIIPAIPNPQEKEVEAAMNAFLPLYRAVKESYERRPFWQWITNHSQYVTERETAKALRGLLMSLTGSSARELDERLDLYCKKVNGDHFTPKERSKMVSAIRNGAKIDPYSEPNEGISIEEALKKDPTAYISYVPRLPEFEEIDFEFEPEQVEDESKWKEEDKAEFESDDFEVNLEHITKKTKWGKTDTEELASVFNAPEENSTDGSLLDENTDLERMRLPVDEALVSIDGGERSELIDDKTVIVPPNISK